MSDDKCNTRFRRSRLLYWALDRGYWLGVIRSFGIHGLGGGGFHVTHWSWTFPGRGPYAFGWPTLKWSCLLRRRHWPYWPGGEPVFMGLCGKCCRCSGCGSIERFCEAGCPLQGTVPA